MCFRRQAFSPVSTLAKTPEKGLRLQLFNRKTKIPLSEIKRDLGCK
jgi:hypothetical protein